MGLERHTEVALDQDLGISKGDVVGGKYRVVRILGQGGMGVVAEALHEALGQRVAIKFLRPEVAGSKDAAARFLLEAKAIARIKSVHVARVTDISTADDYVPFFVMEYLEGQDLEARLAKTGPLPITTAVDYAIQVCEALAEAHAAGIIHRDIKPSNLFLTEASDGATLVKLLDFGISKHTSLATGASLDMTGTRALLGTPRYMAPEQMRSMRRIDHRADIWSLGVVLHQSLTGHTPFVGETLPEVCAAIAADDAVRVRQLRREVPIELQDVLLRCLEKTPERRYPDVGLLASELAPFASPDAAVAARRIGRIVAVSNSTVPPPSVDPASIPEVPPSIPEQQTYGAPGPLPAPVAPPSLRRHDARKDLRRWLLILAAVAIPASLVGAFVRAPSPPEASPAPAPTPKGIATDGAMPDAGQPLR